VHEAPGTSLITIGHYFPKTDLWMKEGDGRHLYVR
jgi:hypothetical protein